MPLPDIQLDDRRFEELFQEASGASRDTRPSGRI